jgi:peptide/nickel transport system permease protein
LKSAPRARGRVPIKAETGFVKSPRGSHLRGMPAVDGGPWRRSRSWRRFRANRVAVIASIVLVAIVGFVLSAGAISAVTGFSPAKGDLRQPLLPPLTAGHLLGTDSSGRDLLVRLSYGGRTSLLVAGVAAITTLCLGGAIGSLSGYAGGWVDAVLMRLVDVLLALPGLSILILVSVLYQPGTVGLALLLAGLGWTGIARIVRGEVLSLRSRDFITAARMTGAPDLYIVRRHILPNVMPTMVVWTSLAIPGLVLTEAGLSFLGFGVQIPTPSWGNMLEQAKDFYSASWTNVFIPGCMIYITVLAISLVGNGLRDAIDPRGRQL